LLEDAAMKIKKAADKQNPAGSQSIVGLGKDNNIYYMMTMPENLQGRGQRNLHFCSLTQCEFK
jgi:hypothetical protein